MLLPERGDPTIKTGLFILARAHARYLVPSPARPILVIEIRMLLAGRG
jgi:hypothetical protein